MRVPRKPQTKRTKLIPFSEEEWGDLVEKISKGDLAAEHALFEKYTPLMVGIVLSCANKYHRTDIDALVSLAKPEFLALVKKCKKCQNGEQSFVAYVRNSLPWKIQECIRADETIARKHRNRSATIPTVSFDGDDQETASGDRVGNRPLDQVIEDMHILRPDQYAEAMSELRYSRKRIKSLMVHMEEMGLSHRYQEILIIRHGLDRSEEDDMWGIKKTLDCIGKTYNVSKERVRQIINKAWRRLSRVYAMEDLENDIATILTYRELVIS